VRAVEHAYTLIGKRCANCTWSGKLSFEQLKSATANL
jgi:hypothetical protein